MASTTVRERAIHILDAMAMIETKTNKTNLDDFKADDFLRLGVERCQEIVSEASRHLPEAAKSEHPDSMATRGRHRQSDSARLSHSRF